MLLRHPAGGVFCWETWKEPLQALRASSPKGAPLRSAGNFTATTKSRPLGEGGCEHSEQTEGVARSAALSQNAALQMQFAATTPPVKMGFRKVRRLS